MKIFGSIKELVSTVFRKDSFEITLKPHTDAYTTNVTVLLPPDDGTSGMELVELDVAQTITNKTFDNTNVYNVKDVSVTFEDDGDATKKFQFEASGITPSNTRIYTVPDENTTLVGTDATQTLTNKTITDPVLEVEDASFTLKDDGDTTKKAQFELSGITTATTRSYTFPDADTTLVGTATTQTLTNKTIDADNNTISNLAHGAEVDNPSSGVHGVTGNVVGTTDTQTLTNKTITSAIAETDLTLNDVAELRFKGTTDEDYLSFKAPADVTATVNFTLPDGDGTSNQVLSTNGAGTLAWASVAAAEEGGHTLIKASNGSKTISSAQCLWAPYLTVSTGHTYTIDASAQMAAFGTVTVDGTLIVNGTSEIIKSA